MNRPVQANGLPLEITRSIVRIASRIDDRELPKPRDPYGRRFLNRFSRSARTTRAVCRQWKELTDERSNYSSRVSFIIMKLDDRSFNSDLEEKEQKFPRLLKEFQSDLQIACDSLLSVSIGFNKPVFMGLNTVQEHWITLFCDEVLRLTSCDGPGSRLVSMDLAIRLAYFGIEHILPGWVAQPTVGDPAIHIPSTLHSLCENHRHFNLETLFTPNLQLRELKIHMPLRWNIENQLSNIRLNSLVSLEVSAETTAAAANLIRSIGYRHLEHLSIVVGSCNYETDPQALLGIDNHVSLPHLKTLHIDVVHLVSLFVLGVVHIPGVVLEKFTISQCIPTYQDLLKQEQGPWNSHKSALPKVQSRSIEIAQTPHDSVLLLDLPMYSDREFVRILRLILDLSRYHEAEKKEISTYRGHFPGLQSLAIQAGYDNIDVMTHVLSGISTGQDLHTLHIELRPGIPYGSPFINTEPDLSIWDNFVVEASSQGRYSSITTLVTTLIWPIPASEFNEDTPVMSRLVRTLFVLAPRVRTLVLKVEPIRTRQCWPLYDLEPARALSARGERGKVHLPFLEMIILEYQHPVTMGSLEHLRLQFENELPSLTTDRVLLGARAISTVILKCAGEEGIPEFRDYPQKCGILLRLEAVEDGSKFMKEYFTSQSGQPRYL